MATTGGTWDKAVISIWPADLPLLAEADASADALNNSRQVATVVPSFTRPQQFCGRLLAAFCIYLR